MISRKQKEFLEDYSPVGLVLLVYGLQVLFLFKVPHEVWAIPAAIGSAWYWLASARINATQYLDNMGAYTWKSNSPYAAAQRHASKLNVLAAILAAFSVLVPALVSLVTFSLPYLLKIYIALLGMLT